MYTALVVDDDPHVCALTARALRQRRFTCLTSADGDQALATFRANPCDAVVTDLRMPNRHGHALAVELLRFNPRPKIVVLTGLIEPKLTQDLVQRGVDEIVPKPANFDNLANTVLRLVYQDKPPQATQPGAVSGGGPTEQDSQQALRQIEASLLDLTDLFANRLEGVFDNAGDLSDPPPAVKNFITRQTELEKLAEENGEAKNIDHGRRARARARCDATALAIPLNTDLAVIGDPFKLAVRDVSESGLRLLHTRAVTAKHFALSWGPQTQPFKTIQVAARVMRCRPLSPFYDIGCQFVLMDA